MSDRKGVIIIYLTDTAMVSVFFSSSSIYFFNPSSQHGSVALITVTMRCWYLVDAVVAAMV